MELIKALCDENLEEIDYIFLHEKKAIKKLNEYMNNIEINFPDIDIKKGLTKDFLEKVSYEHFMIALNYMDIRSINDIFLLTAGAKNLVNVAKHLLKYTFIQMSTIQIYVELIFCNKNSELIQNLLEIYTFPATILDSSFINNAVKNEMWDIVEMLINLGANIHYENEIILIYSIMKNIDVAKKFIEMGSDIQMTLTTICENPKMMSSVIKLLKLGANPNFNDRSAIKIALFSNNYKILVTLLNSGGIIKFEDLPIICSTNCSKENMIFFIEKCQNDCENRQEILNRSLSLCILNNNLDCVKILVKHGADINFYKNTPLRIAENNDHGKIMAYLIKQQQKQNK